MIINGATHTFLGAGDFPAARGVYRPLEANFVPDKGLLSQAPLFFGPVS